jgi:hypothetical protein
MGFLSFLNKTRAPSLGRLPSGSFTLDRSGRVLASTLPQSFPMSLIQEVGRHVLAAFRSAEATQVPLSQLIAEYSSLKVTARELRGGVIVFLTPRGMANK